MPVWVRDAGAWKPVLAAWVRDGGAWRPVNQLWVRDAGAWKEASILIITVAETSQATRAGILGKDYDGRVQFSVGADTSHVEVEVNSDGAGFSLFETIAVTGGGSGYWTSWQPFNFSLQIRLTPRAPGPVYGPPVTVNVTT